MTDTVDVPTAAGPAPAIPRTPAWARLVSRAVDPMTVILVVLVAVGAARHGLTGAAWGLVGALFSGVVPQVAIAVGVRKGTVGDRYVRDRSKRTPILLLIMLSVAVGLCLMSLGGAPSVLTAMVLGQFGTMIPATAITTRWKISLHTCAAGGAVAMLTVAFGAWWLLGYLLVALVGWSRVILRDHTAAQTIAGCLLGSVTAGTVFWLIQH